MNKNNISKLLILLLVACFSLSISLFIACNNDKDSSNLHSSSATTNTSDSSSVSEDSSSDEIGDRAYFIKLSHEEIYLIIADEFSIKASLYLGSSLIENVEFTFSSLNNSVTTVNNEGLIVAVGAGQTKIKVKANGYENVEVFVDVYVSSDLTLDLSQTVVSLAKVEKFGYSNNVEIDFTVKKEQVEVANAEITLTTSNANVSAEVSNGKILLTANEDGECIVTASYGSSEEVVETTIIVNVTKPMVVVNEPYLFSTAGAKDINLANIAITKEENCQASDIVKVYGKDCEFEVTQKTGTVIKLDNVQSLGELGVKTAVTLEFIDYKVQVELQGYTHVIRTAQDFDDMKQFLKDTTLKAEPESVTDSGYCKIIEGYYILANDIDFTDYYQAHNVDYYASPFSYRAIGNASFGFVHGWNATFDGNGHQIKNLILGKGDDNWGNSLFGTINGNKGVIKNVAFTNCAIAEGQNLRGASFLAHFVYGTVENVYVDVSFPKNEDTGSYSSKVVAVNNNYSYVKNFTILVRNNLVENATNKDIVYDSKQAKNALNSIRSKFIIIGGAVPNTQLINSKQEDIAGNKYIQLYSDKNDLCFTQSQENGSLSIQTSEEGFTLFWNGSEVYTYDYVPKLSEYLYSVEEGCVTLPDSLNAGEVIEILRDGASVDFDIEGNTIYFMMDEVLNDDYDGATGSKLELILKTATEEIVLPLKVYTDVIDSVEEFMEMGKFMKNGVTGVYDGNSSSSAGYNKIKVLYGAFALGCDLDFADYPDFDSPFGFLDFNKTGVENITSVSETFGFNATFEGNGYQIKNLCVKGTGSTYDQSLFGIVGPSGVIQNLSFVNCSLANGLNRSAFLATTFYGKLENVYLDVKMPESTESSKDNSAFVGRGLAGDGNGIPWVYFRGINNVVVNVSGVMSVDSYILRGTSDALARSDKTSNFVILANGIPESQICYNVTTKTGMKNVAELNAINSKIKAYSSVDAMAGEIGSTVFGDISLTSEVAKYNIYWRDALVYSAKCSVVAPYKGIIIGEDESGNPTYKFSSSVTINTGIKAGVETAESGIIEYTVSYKKHSANTYFALMFFVGDNGIDIDGAKPSTGSFIRVTFRPNTGAVWIGESESPSNVGSVKADLANNEFAKLITNTADGETINLNIKVVYAQGLFEFYINDLLYFEYGSQKTALKSVDATEVVNFKNIIDGLTGTDFGFSTYTTDPAKMPEIIISNIKVS